MTQTGIVQSVAGETVRVDLNRTKRAAGELVPACCSDAGATVEARNPRHLALCPGDTVDLVYPSGSLVLPVGLGIGMPLVGLFASYFLAGSLVPGAGDAVRAGLAVAGLAAGSLVPVLWFRFRKVADSRPVVRPR